MTFLYEKICKPILFLIDPTTTHNLAIFFGKILAHPPFRWITKALYFYEHDLLKQEIADITFKNPIGLAAGFDKNCELLKLLPAVGFGFIEVGSITAEPYKGNPGKHAIRLPKEKSLLINYGLKNEGAKKLRARLLKTKTTIPVGVSIARTNKQFKNVKEQLKDWLVGTQLLQKTGDYLTLNLSCPNLVHDTSFTEPKLLRQLLLKIKKGTHITKPVFLKINGEHSEKELDQLLRIVIPFKFVTGLIISNLAKQRKKIHPVHQKKIVDYKGGLSGKPVKADAIKAIRYIKKKSKNRFVLIGCGGIFSAQDAWDYFAAGASLVQLITGMIYQGPGLIKQINKELVSMMVEQNVDSIKDISML